MKRTREEEEQEKEEKERPTKIQCVEENKEEIKEKPKMLFVIAENFEEEEIQSFLELWFCAHTGGSFGDSSWEKKPLKAFSVVQEPHRMDRMCHDDNARDEMKQWINPKTFQIQKQVAPMMLCDALGIQ